MIKRSSRIAIIGAGVAGLATAIRLRDLGYDPVVYEAGSLSSNVGGGIGLWPNAVKILDNLGLSQPLSKITGELTRINYALADGSRIRSIPIETYLKNPKFSINFVLRHELVRILLGNLHPNCIELNMKFIDAYQDEESVVLKFDNDCEERFDLVVAADGINSSLVKIFFPEQSKIFCGHVSIGGILKNYEPKNHFIYAVKRLSVAFPTSNNQGYMIAFMPSKDGKFREMNRQEQINAFRGWSVEVDELLNHLNEENYFCVDSYFVPIPPSIAKGRVLFIGDAAHAMSPISSAGAGLALEDAWAVGQAMNSAFSCNEVASLFNRQHLDRVKEVVAFCNEHFIANFFSNSNEEQLAKNMETFKALNIDTIVNPLKDILQRGV